MRKFYSVWGIGVGCLFFYSDYKNWDMSSIFNAGATISRTVRILDFFAHDQDYYSGGYSRGSGGYSSGSHK